MKDANEITKIKAELNVIVHGLNQMSPDDGEAIINHMLMITETIRELANVVNALDITTTSLCNIHP